MTNHDEIIKNVKLALEEDIGSGDVTTDLVEPYSLAEATLISHDNAILCGIDWFNEVFNQLDNSIEIKWLANDGEKIKSSQTICNLHGPIHSILSGERTAINFLQLLSGVSTNVAAFVSRIKNTKTKILDTRKTIPGLRYAQKYAVTVGGGINHRKGLYDEVLIKENHISASGSIEKTIEKAKEKGLPITIEVENLSQLERALKTNVDRIMLDNFTPPNIYKAVNMANGKIKLEASGNTTILNVHTIAGTGVDYISIGALTKNIKAVDFSLLANLVYVAR
ncbi:MAG: carboxylating nicotinate-nucleotide diphosphorylase [Pseudomonadota bacterium]|nr:carboxylating nicotinate-nucleotide diphosphorylase [Pseudomonadota bacterium]